MVPKRLKGCRRGSEELVRSKMKEKEQEERVEIRWMSKLRSKKLPNHQPGSVTGGRTSLV